MSFARLSIRSKFLVSFGSVVALLLIIGSLSTLTFVGLSRQSALIANDIYPKAVLADAVLKRALEAEGLAYRTALVSGDDEHQQLVTRIKEIVVQNKTDMERLDHLVVSHDGRALFDDINQARAQVVSLYPRLFALIEQRDVQAIGTFVAREYTPAILQLRGSIDRLSEHQSRQMDESVAGIQRDSASAEQMMVVASSAGLVLGIGLAVWLAGYFARRIHEAYELASRVGSGDLRSDGKQPVDGDELARLMSALLGMRGRLSTTVQTIVEQGNLIAESAAHLAAASQQVAVSSQRQSVSTAAAAASVEQLSVSIEQVNENASESSVLAKQVDSLASSVQVDATDAQRCVVDVVDRVGLTSTQIQSLNDKTQQIGVVTTVIQNVADQTNLLALNAAIEAARAGEQGRGFAVVADEVRKLAERTSHSVQEIAAMITNIQDETLGALTSMQASKELVDAVAQSAQRSAGSMGAICTSASSVESVVGEIHAALGEQRSASGDLSRNIEAIAQMSEENNTAIGAVAETARRMEEIALSLKQQLAAFAV